MRKANKEITDARKIEELMHAAGVLHLAMNDGDGPPYVVPMHFGYEGGRIFMHSATEGKKIDLLRKDPRVAFSLVEEYEVLPEETACAFSTRYASATGRGTARLLEEPGEKLAALATIMADFGVANPEFKDKALGLTAVIEVTVTELVGKQSPAPSKEREEGVEPAS